MNTRNTSPTKTPPRTLLRAAVLALAAVCLSAAPALGQATGGGTSISNTASASYSDGSTTYTVNSNPVTVTVANVAGLTITPDGTSAPTVVAGQTNVDFTFTVTNSGNYATQVFFPASGGGIFTTGPVTVTGAVIDLTGNGYDNSDTSILGSAVTYPASPFLARNASFNVIVRVSVNAAANPNDAISVKLGDALADNAAWDNSATSVRTSNPSGSTLTGPESEAVGSISTSVENDARLQAELSVPAGPVALGSNITYSATLRNVGLRPVGTQTLQNAPAGSNTGVYLVIPVPANTALQSVPAPPAGVTVLYSVSPLGNDPGPGDPPASGPLSNAVVWTTTPPAVLSSTTRVAFRVNGGAAVPAAAVYSSLNVVLTVQTGVNATLPLYGIAEAFGRNSLSNPITDQSDQPAGEVANKGDGNANFNEPKFGVDPASTTKGFLQPTTLVKAGLVLLGPSGAPGAVGPNGNNNLDYTNKSVPATAITGKSHLDQLSGAVNVDFVNTVQNTGNADDTFTITVPTVPAGFSAFVSTDGGTTFVPASTNPTVAVAFGASANFIVRVTTSSSAAVLQGFDTVVRATSANTPAESNNTIDRVYTGFLKLVKTVQVFNSTGVGGPSDAVPGADLEYSITYSNISAGDGGAGCANLVATNVVINEDGNAPGNTWGSTTTQLLNPVPADSNGGTITDGNTVNGPITATTTFLKDAAGTVNPGASKVFVFRRRIK
ncbi:MAG TPA: hypothetical protein VF736_07670 [Pyrinomonadaceae bacterium]|jgi:hypothetical protein